MSQSVVPHWFYSIDEKSSWLPFSQSENDKLEAALKDNSKITYVFGKRYKADINTLSLTPVYWEKYSDIHIRRTWWYAPQLPAIIAPDYFTLSEKDCEILESVYCSAKESNSWPTNVDLGETGRVIIEGAALIILQDLGKPIQKKNSNDQAGTASTDDMMEPVAIGINLKRGFTDDFYKNLPDAETENFDHVALVVHGIGGCCDLRLRPLPECVNDMRQLTNKFFSDPSLMNTSTGQSSETKPNSTGAIEFLPIQWHQSLHSGPDDLDRKLSKISLESCGKLRDFVNDTVLDVLLFTSPVYHQKIIGDVLLELNRVYSLFRTMHPDFSGKVSLVGHSLGTVILFDILTNLGQISPLGQISHGPCKAHGGAKLLFEPESFFMMGSPIGMFLTVGGVNAIPNDYWLKPCKNVYNIFHPYDLVAYRIEPLVQQTDDDINAPEPSLIPHHRGRKRLHLEVKDAVFKFGDDIKRRVFESIQTFTGFLKGVAPEGQPESNDPDTMEEETGQVLKQPSVSNPKSTKMFDFGSLNQTKRIDYALQEAPIEITNPYLFSIAAHLVYWQSEDTCLFIARALYESSLPSDQ